MIKLKPPADYILNVCDAFQHKVQCKGNNLILEVAVGALVGYVL